MKQLVDKKTMVRRLLIRLALVVVYVGLVMATFVLGKGHSLIIDNKDLDDGTLTAAMEGNLVSIDGKEATEVYPGDRIMETVKGQTHTVAIEDMSGGNRIERRITLPLGEDTLLVSIPKLIAGVAPAVEVFVPLNVAPPSESESDSKNEFTSPDAVPLELLPTP